MQLAQVFRRAGRATWLLLAVPVLAIAAVTALLLAAPPEYSTNATVSVIVPQGTDTAATVSQAVDTFKSAIVSETVVQLAAQDSGTPLNAAQDVSAERVATSNLVELGVTTNRPDDGDEAVRSLVEQTNATVFASTIASAQARVDVAEERYSAALEERRAQTLETGVQLPIEAYRAKLNEVSQLQVARVTTESDARRSAVEARLRAAREELQGIGKTLEEYEAAQDRVTRTRTELGDAQQEVDAATSKLDAASSSSSVSIADSQLHSRRANVMRGVISALLLGLAVATGLILLFGLFRRAPEVSEGAAALDKPAPGPTDPPATKNGAAGPVGKPSMSRGRGHARGEMATAPVPTKLERRGRR